MLGTIRWKSVGREISVFGGTKSKRDRLLHNVLVSKFGLPWWMAGYDWRAGAECDPEFRADGELHGDAVFYVELDRATEKVEKQVKTRLSLYRQIPGRSAFRNNRATARGVGLGRCAGRTSVMCCLPTIDKTREAPFGPIWRSVEDDNVVGSLA